MNNPTIQMLIGSGIAAALGATALATMAGAAPAPVKAAPFGRVDVSTLPVDPRIVIRTATYTPSGKVLVSYAEKAGEDEQFVRLATVDDDGRNWRPFFAQKIPERPKDNGLRFMIFPDDRRIFLGDFVVECDRPLDSCVNPALYPVQYPAEVADGPHIGHRWSEMIVSPDNRHVAWTTLFSNYSAMVFTGEMVRQGAGYTITGPQIVSTLNPFAKDPRHADGVLPQTIRGGEVKQYVDGGRAISMAGAIRHDTPDSVVQHLDTGRMEGITDTPGYTETTIFSPDERLGVTMTTRFSERTDPAILGLVPRPYPVALNMGLSMFAYTYGVTGVRQDRPGNVGPALLDIAASKSQPGYQGVNLSRDADWVFHSPLSWHPGGKSALWMEGHRRDGTMRIRLVRLPDYRPGAKVPVKALPARIPESSTDLSVVRGFPATADTIDVKVYGRASGHIAYRRAPDGSIEKRYVDFSDDGRQRWSGSETMKVNMGGRSTYVANVRLTGPQPGMMDLRITFGPLGGRLPASILFGKDADGAPLSHGHVEFGGRRIDVDTMAP